MICTWYQKNIYGMAPFSKINSKTKKNMLIKKKIVVQVRRQKLEKKKKLFKSGSQQYRYSNVNVPTFSKIIP